jgi:hypothetical protein
MASNNRCPPEFAECGGHRLADALAIGFGAFG